MRTYSCTCDNTLFYDNNLCLRCGSAVGYCPACRQVVALQPTDDGSWTCGNSACGAVLEKCANYSQHNVCNRCVPAESAAEAPLCDCCRFNVTIPDLSVEGNLQKWQRLEAAKRRLFYELGELGLPYGTAADGVDPPLSFDFKADIIPNDEFWRNVGGGQRVYTGHANGRITINIREADDVQREQLRVELGEAQRTLIGHFRHEIGHYYWDMLVKGRREDEFATVFGDHRQPTYAEALERYYQDGAAPDWSTRLISAYASMHPWEDFAETWAAYLDMIAALDTAQHMGFGGQTEAVHAEIEPMIRLYQELGVGLNELNRSFGLPDAVPEVFIPPVVEKMKYLHELVRQGRQENGALQPATSPPDAIVAEVPTPAAAPQLTSDPMPAAT